MSKLLPVDEFPRESTLSPRPDLILYIDADSHTIVASQARSSRTMQQTAAEIVDHLIEMRRLPQIEGDVSVRAASPAERQAFLESGEEYLITAKAPAPAP